MRNWKLQHFLSDIGDLDESATAEKIYSVWNNQLEKWRLPVNKLVACTIDGGSNFQAAGRRYQTYNIWCYCHRLHLVAKDILEDKEIKECYLDCKNVANLINKSFPKSKKLDKTLKKTSNTRWNSAVNLFQSLLVIPDILKGARLKATLLDWKLINFLNALLQPLAVTLRRLEGDQDSIANVIIPYIYALKSKWNQLKSSSIVNMHAIIAVAFR